MKRLSFIAMAMVALSGCSNPTPEEARANLERDYLESCEMWGTYFELSELGADAKYKDWSLLKMYDAQKKLARTPDLDQLDCPAAFDKGVEEGRRRVSEGLVEAGSKTRRLN